MLLLLKWARPNGLFIEAGGLSLSGGDLVQCSFERDNFEHVHMRRRDAAKGATVNLRTCAFNDPTFASFVLGEKGIHLSEVFVLEAGLQYTVIAIFPVCARHTVL